MQQRGRKIEKAIPAVSIFGAIWAMMRQEQQTHVAAHGSHMRKIRKDSKAWTALKKKKHLRRIERLARRVARQVRARR